MLSPTWQLKAAPLVSPSAGSTVVGRHDAESEQLVLAKAVVYDLERVTVEGRLESLAYRKPDGRTGLEIFGR